MKCWNCLKKLPDDAQVCPFCEAALKDEPLPGEIEAVQQLLDEMPADILGDLKALVANSDSAEDFVNRIFVGDCPRCDSPDTGDCENDPEIDNLLVGRCYQCGHLWCTECQKPLDAESPECPCWDEEVEF
ncbi:MAG: hypothetical protein ACYC6Y_12150 [Thermoguttaceae bacterium]